MPSANYSRNNRSAQSRPTPRDNPYAAPETNTLPTPHRVTTTQNPLTQPEKDAEAFKVIAAAAAVFGLLFTYQSLLALANQSFAPVAVLAILASGAIIIGSRGKINQLKSQIKPLELTTQQATDTNKSPSN